MPVILVNGKFEIDHEDHSDDYDTKPDPIYDLPRENPKIAAPEYMAFTIYAFQEHQRIIRKLQEEYKNNPSSEAMFLRADLRALDRFAKNAEYGFQLGELRTRHWEDAYYVTKKQRDSKTRLIMFLWQFIERLLSNDHSKIDKGDKD